MLPYSRCTLPKATETINITKIPAQRIGFKVVRKTTRRVLHNDSSPLLNLLTITKYELPDEDPATLEEVCKKFIQHKSQGKTTPFKSVEDISSIFNKRILEMMSVKIANASVMLRGNNGKEERQAVIGNIYMMISLFVASLKITGIDIKIMPLIFGESTGAAIDLAYRTALTLAAMKVINKNEASFDVSFPSFNTSNAELFSLVFESEPALTQQQQYQMGGTNPESSLFTLDYDHLDKLYTKISTNVTEFMNALA